MKQKKITPKAILSLLLIFSQQSFGNEDIHTDGMSYRGRSIFEGRQINSILGDRDFSGESMYTGDVSFSIPITEIGEVSVVLNYNSNVHKQILEDNIDMQSGWIGIGWSMEFGSISADINNTKDVADDHYFYNGPDGTSEMYIIPGEAHKFRLKDYQYWIIERVLDMNQNIIGWVIRKDDGTIYRFGNVNQSSDFIFDYDETNNDPEQTNGTRFFLGMSGRVSSIPEELFGQEELIAYQWDLSDIEDTFGNHTKIYHYLELRKMYGNGSTTLHYTHASYPREIVDHTGRKVRFIIYLLAGGNGPDYNAPLNHQQRLFQMSRLSEIQIYNGNTFSQSYELEPEYADVHDIFDIQRKHYLKSITQKDPLDNDNQLPATTFTYWGIGAANPGALKKITYPAGGTIEYSYQSLPLDSVNLDKSDILDNEPHVNQTQGIEYSEVRYGMSGSDFKIIKDEHPGASPLSFFRWKEKTWESDEPDEITIYTEDFWIIGECFVVNNWYYKTFYLYERRGDGWKIIDLGEAIRQLYSPPPLGGSFKIIGIGKDFFVVRECMGDLDDDLFVVSWNNRQWQVQAIDDLVIDDLPTWAYCGNRYFIIQRDNSGFFYQWNAETGCWQKMLDVELPYLTSYTKICTANDYFAVYTDIPEPRIEIFQWTGTSWEKSETSFYNGVIYGGDLYAGDDFFVAVSRGLIEGETDPGPIYLYKKEEDGNSWNLQSVSDLVSGTNIPDDFRFAKVVIDKKDVFIGFRHENVNGTDAAGVLFTIDTDNSQVSQIDIIEDFKISENELSTVIPSTNGSGTVYALWDDEAGNARVNFYTKKGSNWNEGVSIDTNSTQTFGQAGGDFFAVVSANKITKSFKQGFDSNFNIIVTGNPYDFPVMSKTICDGIDDPVTMNFEYENGIYDKGISVAKYNKSTITYPENSGKQISYFYNDLPKDETVDSDKYVDIGNDGLYEEEKELDGMVYCMEKYNNADPGSILETTVNTHSLYVIDENDLIYHPRLKISEITRDFVTNTISYTYNDNNGLVSTNSVINSDNSVKVTKYTYAHGIDDYSVMADDTVHMLSQIAWTTVYETDANDPANARSSEVTTFNNTLVNGKWTSDRTYKWRENEDSVYLDNFTEWSSGTPDLEWLSVSQVTDRDEYGNILEYLDAYNTPTTIKWGYNKSVPIATVANAMEDEVFVDDFGDGNMTDWVKIDVNNDGDTEWSVEGAQLKLVNYALATNGECDRIYYDNGIEIDDSTVLEFDIKIADSDNWDLTIAMGGSSWGTGNGGSENAIWTSINNEEWKYYCGSWYTIKSELKIGQKYHFKIDAKCNTNKADFYVNGERLVSGADFRYSSSGIQKIAFGNYGYGSVTTIWYIDNVRVYPSDALCTSQSYNPLFMTISENIDENGFSIFYEIDDFGRLDKSRNGNGEVLIDYDYYYSREGNGDVFNSNDPNYVKTRKYYLNSYEDDFSNSGESSPCWQAVNGNWYYYNGQIIQSSNTAACFFMLKSPYNSYSDLEMGFKMKSTDDDIMGCVFRYSDPYNFYKFVMEKQRSFWGLYKTVEGVTTALVKNGNTYVSGQWYNIRIVCKGENIQVYVNDEKAFDVNDNTFSCGQVGLHCHCNYSSYYDDFQIKGNSSETITYYDGLGRDIQTQTRHGDKDIIVDIDYDAFNREVKRWKPYVADTDHSYTALYDADEQEPKSACYYYDGKPGPDCGDYPYSEIVYRNAFSEEVVNLGAPGVIYQKNSGNTIDYSYGTNTTSEFGYTANSLYKTTVNDENNHDNEIFTDKFGNKVGQISPGGIKTAFVYDISGNLTEIQPHNYFYPPHGSYVNWLTSYQYNTLGQMTWKKTPDAGVVEYLYDKNGNLRFIDDALQYGLIIYYKYDDLNRVIEEGTCTHDYFYQEAADGTSQPPSGTVKVNYFYDDPASGCPQTQHNVKGRLSKVEYQDENSSNWGTTYYSYTNEGWIEWIIQDLPGNEVANKTIEYEYDLQGDVTKINYNPGEEEKMFFWYDYNEQGQLWKVFASTNNIKPSLASAIYEYWPTGQVKKLILGEQSGGGYLEQLNYTYNERDWMKNINGNDYDQILYYSGPPNGTSQYNGNISLISYFMNHRIGTHKNNPSGSYAHRYAYSYDDLNRLNAAQFSFLMYPQNNWKSANNYSVPQISYDGMGNIERLTRNNNAGSGIVYDYKYYDGSNKLKNLDGSTAINYEYDLNGNLIRDVGKIGAGTIYYDHRNQPYKVQDESNHTIKYGYDNTGTRIYKKYTTGSNLNHAYYYVNDATGRTLAVYDKNGDMIFINLYGLDLIGKVQWVE
jgi:hypothetical protein